MRVIALLLIGSGLVACGGGGDDDDDGADAASAVTLAFTSPAAGATVSRDVLEPIDGWVAAPIAIQLAVTGDVATIELSAGTVALGVADASGALDGFLTGLGPTTVTATARDAGGAVVATATVEVTVVDPELANCRGWLDQYGVAYTVPAPRDGVADPVTLTTPINGMVYRYLDSATTRATFFMDCSLARSLVRAAPHWRARDIVEVQDIGVYNYRCIGSGTPPNCPQGLSQHAYAKAIDLARFVHADGTTYTVETDWVIDPTGGMTCTAETSDAKDTWLHAVICALKADAVWTIALTPNYNASHRNHFHVDLTAGSNFIRKEHEHHAMDEGPDDF